VGGEEERQIDGASLNPKNGRNATHQKEERKDLKGDVLGVVSVLIAVVSRVHVS